MAKKISPIEWVAVMSRILGGAARSIFHPRSNPDGTEWRDLRWADAINIRREPIATGPSSENGWDWVQSPGPPDIEIIMGSGYTFDDALHERQKRETTKRLVGLAHQITLMQPQTTRNFYALLEEEFIRNFMTPGASPGQNAFSSAFTPPLGLINPLAPPLHPNSRSVFMPTAIKEGRPSGAYEHVKAFVAEQARQQAKTLERDLQGQVRSIASALAMPIEEVLKKIRLTTVQTMGVPPFIVGGIDPPAAPENQTTGGTRALKPSELLRVLKTYLPAGLPILVKGPPGVGKTDLFQLAAEACNMHFRVTHPVTSDPVDYKGVPFPSDDRESAKFLPFGDLLELAQATEPTLFLFDDLGQAPPAVQAAAMQLILARRINGHPVADCVTFAAATNRKGDRAGVSGILEPVKSRFATILELGVDCDDWCDWALSHGMPAELIAFIRWRPELLHKFEPTADIINTPCPRTVAFLGKLYNHGIPEGLFMEVAAGAVGSEFATEFTSFLQLYANLPDIEKILSDPATAPIPTDTGLMFGLCGALANLAEVDVYDALMEYARRLKKCDKADFAVLLVGDCIRRGGDAFTNSGAYTKWAVENGEVMMGDDVAP